MKEPLKISSALTRLKYRVLNAEYRILLYGRENGASTETIFDQTNCMNLMTDAFESANLSKFMHIVSHLRAFLNIIHADFGENVTDWHATVTGIMCDEN